MTNEIMNDSDKHGINDPYMFLQLSYNYSDDCDSFNY